MLAFELIRILDPRVTPSTAKFHLASWNGEEDPLRVYLEGRFDEWQSWQTRRNFEREFVISLIKLSERDKWLFVGAFSSHSLTDPVAGQSSYKYGLSRLPACDDLQGRLVVSFVRSGRQSYLNGESCVDRMTVHEIRAEPMHLDEFPGFKKVALEFPDLEIVVRQNTTSWRTALSNVAGVYLISDPESGKLYVGSATGEGGIWSRWCQYADGHGNNVELRKVIAQLGVERAKAFRFSILEISDLHSSRQEVLERESHWKRVLLTREHGYNAN